MVTQLWDYATIVINIWYSKVNLCDKLTIEILCISVFHVARQVIRLHKWIGLQHTKILRISCLYIPKPLTPKIHNTTTRILWE